MRAPLILVVLVSVALECNGRGPRLGELILNSSERIHGSIHNVAGGILSGLGLQLNKQKGSNQNGHHKSEKPTTIIIIQDAGSGEALSQEYDKPRHPGYGSPEFNSLERPHHPPPPPPPYHHPGHGPHPPPPPHHFDSSEFGPPGPPHHHRPHGPPHHRPGHGPRPPPPHHDRYGPHHRPGPPPHFDGPDHGPPHRPPHGPDYYPEQPGYNPDYNRPDNGNGPPNYDSHERPNPGHDNSGNTDNNGGIPTNKPIEHVTREPEHHKPDHKPNEETPQKPIEKTTAKPDDPIQIPLGPNDYTYGGDKITVNQPKRETEQGAEKKEDEVYAIDIRFKDD